MLRLMGIICMAELNNSQRRLEVTNKQIMKCVIATVIKEERSVVLSMKSILRVPTSLAEENPSGTEKQCRRQYLSHKPNRLFKVA